MRILVVILEGNLLSRAMENKYGQAALIAVKSKGQPADRWLEATAVVFPRSPSSQIKSCPKGAFLGLCEEGVVQGIESGTYTTSTDNKRYALRGLALLKRRTSYR